MYQQRSYMKLIKQKQITVREFDITLSLFIVIIIIKKKKVVLFL